MNTQRNPTRRWPPAVIAFAATAVSALADCRGSRPAATPSREQAIADAIYTVVSADRETYTADVVNRLQNEEKVIAASQHWKDDRTLPLPAQMFRLGAERVRQRTRAFSYALVSRWPINKQNAPRTAAEEVGFTALVAGAPSYYREEELGGQRWFTAVYPDRAVSKACIDCHNRHAESPRRDFRLQEVMGAVVVRVAR
jgi:hypothetical protein